MNLMLINVWTRKLRREVRLPESDLLATAGDGTSKSAASRRFVALSAERLAEWMASDLSKLDLLVIQIDGLHIGNDLVLVAALGIDGEGYKHPSLPFIGLLDFAGHTFEVLTHLTFEDALAVIAPVRHHACQAHIPAAHGAWTPRDWVLGSRGKRCFFLGHGAGSPHPVFL